MLKWRNWTECIEWWPRATKESYQKMLHDTEETFQMSKVFAFFRLFKANSAIDGKLDFVQMSRQKHTMQFI